MNLLSVSFGKNLNAWKWHLGLWFSKVVTLWFGYITVNNAFDTYLNNRENIPVLWEKTDINVFFDLVSKMPSGVTGSLILLLFVLLALWFVIDTFFDAGIIGKISGVEGKNYLLKVKRLFLARLIFWIPYLIVGGGGIYLGIKLWTKSFTWWPLLFSALAVSFVTFYLIKWLDLAKITIVADEEELKPALSGAGRLVFTDMGPTTMINFVFALFMTVVVYLSIEINLYIIPRGVMSLWVVWILRQIILLLRQYLRYSYTGYWVEFRRK